MSDPRTHICRRGDDIAKLSLEYPEVKWNDLEKAIKDAGRDDPYQLCEGDQLTLPLQEEKEDGAVTEDLHTYGTSVPDLFLHLRVLDSAGYAIANAAYSLSIEGESTPREGTTDDKGQILDKTPVDPSAKTATLTVTVPATTDEEGATEEESTLTWEISISSLHPMAEDAAGTPHLPGIQQRLANLGFYAGELDGEWDDETSGAVAAFCERYGLEAPEKMETEDSKVAPFLEKLNAVHEAVDSVVEPEEEEESDEEATA